MLTCIEEARKEGLCSYADSDQWFPDHDGAKTSPLGEASNHCKADILHAHQEMGKRSVI
jgi:hypothetical protein